MAKIEVGRILAKAIKNEGVDTIFCLPGGHIMSLFYGCREEGIAVIDCRSEATAAFAADAYARATGKPGVVVTTAGPGVVNTTTAMAEAKASCTPLVHIGGAAPNAALETGMLQCMNTLEIMSTVTKWAKRVYNANRVADFISMAFRNAMDDTPGSVYLEVAVDIMFAQLEEEEVNLTKSYRTDAIAYGDPDDIEKAAELICQAKRPCMVIGDAARYSMKNGEYVLKLAEYLQMPVIVNNVARGAFADEKHPLFSIDGKCLRECDLLVELSAANNYLLGKGQAPYINADAKVIQVDTDKKNIGFNLRADVGIIAGAGNAAKQLYEVVSKKMEPVKAPGWTPGAIEAGKDYVKQLDDMFNSDISPVHPARLALEVAKFVDKDDRDWSVIGDGGEASLWITKACKATRIAKVVTWGPLAPLACGPGFALGTYFGNKKPIIYYTGDGSFGYNALELGNFARLNIPMVCIISNDSQWGLIKLLEDLRRPELVKKGYVAVELPSLMRYDKLAELWGGMGFCIDKAEDVIPCIEKIAASGKPGIINVSVDRMALSPMTKSGWLSNII